jgi:hypothetical protein
LKQYQKPIYDAEHGEGPGGWVSILRNNMDVLNEENLKVLKAVHNPSYLMVAVEFSSRIFGVFYQPLNCNNAAAETAGYAYPIQVDAMHDKYQID